MRRNDLLCILCLEMLALVVAGASFALIESKLIAGFVAGSYFVGFGVFGLSRVLRWPRPWRSLTIYPLGFHLFGVSLPLMITRAMHAHQGFADIQILGLTGPQFHQLSTEVFAVLGLATVIDIGRTYLEPRKTRH